MLEDLTSKHGEGDRVDILSRPGYPKSTVTNSERMTDDLGQQPSEQPRSSGQRDHRPTGDVSVSSLDVLDGTLKVIRAHSTVSAHNRDVASTRCADPDVETGRRDAPRVAEDADVWMLGDVRLGHYACAVPASTVDDQHLASAHLLQGSERGLKAADEVGFLVAGWNHDR